LAVLEVVLNSRVFKIRLPLSAIQNPPGKTEPAGISASNKKMRDRATPNAFNIVICYLRFTEGANIPRIGPAASDRRHESMFRPD